MNETAWIFSARMGCMKAIELRRRVLYRFAGELGKAVLKMKIGEITYESIR